MIYQMLIYNILDYPAKLNNKIVYKIALKISNKIRD